MTPSLPDGYPFVNEPSRSYEYGLVMVRPDLRGRETAA
jgi:hypothetical protein